MREKYFIGSWRELSLESYKLNIYHLSTLSYRAFPLIFPKHIIVPNSSNNLHRSFARSAVIDEDEHCEIKSSNVTPRELYRLSSNRSLKVKHAGAFCQRQLAAAVCETAPLYGLTRVRTFAKFHVTRSQSAGEFATPEVSSANVGTRKTNF